MGRISRLGWGGFFGILVLLTITSVLLTGCEPRLQSENPKERIRAVALLDDPVLLEKVACEDEDSGVRRAALTRIKDPIVLGKIARTTRRTDVALAALERTDDPRRLLNLAMTSHLPEVRLEALAKIDDQAGLEQILTDSDDDQLRLAAASRVTNQTLLAQCAAKGSMTAVRALRDIALLAEVAVHSEDIDTHSAAVEGINEQDLLAKIALRSDPIVVMIGSEEPEEPRMLAVEKLSSEALLLEVACRSRSEAMGLAAIRKLRVPAQRVCAAAEAEHATVRSRAFLTLTNSELAALSQEPAPPVAIWHISVLRIILSASQSLPGPHRRRLTEHLLQLADLNDPIITAEVGKIESIDADVRTTSAGYSGVGAASSIPMSAYGETVAISIRMANGDLIASRSWTTEFPRRLWGDVGSFRPASVNMSDLIDQVCRRLSEETLTHLAIHGRQPQIRHSALIQLGKEPLLARVAIETTDANIGRLAVHKVDDQLLLFDIAMKAHADAGRLMTLDVSNRAEGWHTSVAAAAVAKLGDQALLAEVAAAGTNCDARIFAVEKLQNMDLLAHMARDDADHHQVRLAAAKRLDNDTLWADRAIKDPHFEVRVEAAKKMTDQTLLERIAVEDRHWQVRNAATGKVGDQKLLMHLASEDPNHSVRASAASLINDQAVLKRLVADDCSRWVRLAAIRALVDLTTLQNIANSDPDEVVRLRAKARLEQIYRTRR